MNRRLLRLGAVIAVFAAGYLGGLLDLTGDVASLAQSKRAAPTQQQAPAGLGANASLAGLPLFPADSPWNTPVDHLPVDEHSGEYLASIGLEAHLHPDFGKSSDGCSPGIPYVVVDGKQPKFPVRFQWPEESDLGLYPIPPDAPIEGGANADGDRHVLIVDRDNRRLYELFGVRKSGDIWQAGSGAIFDLRSNQLRPAGWTSADAAGLAILPGLVRYEEAVEQQEIRHALRFTAKVTRRAYVFPARHWASRHTDPKLPPMGLRVRLKANYDISGFPPSAQAILKALQRYGMILADNGGNWFVTGAPDSRWNDEELAALKRVKGRDLEAVETGNLVTP